MCTMTWSIHPKGYDVFFNRDEQKSREEEAPPSVAYESTVSYLAPTDTDHYGTWIWVNEYGISAGLLNYFSQNAKTGQQSRGQLMRRLASASSISSLENSLKKVNLEDYSPFTLCTLDRSRNVASWTWNGYSLEKEEKITMPLTSSSWDPDRVIAARRDLFQALHDEQNQDITQEGARSSRTVKEVDPASLLETFHRHSWKDRESESVCMNRRDAQTYSLSHICVRDSRADFYYATRIPEIPAFNDFQIYSLNLQFYSK